MFIDHFIEKEVLISMEKLFEINPLELYVRKYEEAVHTKYKAI